MVSSNPIAAPPKVSVILPCYNVAAFVRTAIESLKAQEFRDFEVLVVDDGSTDATAQMARGAIAGDDRFRLLSQSNQGLSGARNTGLDHARGHYVAFLDGDDWVAPAFLSRMIGILELTGAQWAACGIWLEFECGRRVAHSAIHGAPEITGTARPCDLEDACEVARQFPSVWNKVYRRAFIGALRFVVGALYEDHAFYWALACRSEQIWYLPDALYHHRRDRAGQITAQGTSRIFAQFDRLDEVCAIVKTSAKRHSLRALSRLATRLVHERLEPVTDPALRRAFIDRAKGYFAAHGLTWDWDGAPDIDLRPGPEISPGLRFTVLVQAGAAAERTHRALAAQRLPPTEIIDVPDGPMAEILHREAPRCDTAWCAILKAGDAPVPDWSARMLAVLRDTPGATWAVCPVARSMQEFDTGFALPGLPCADPAAVMISTAAIVQPRPAEPDWATLLRHALAVAPSIVGPEAGHLIALAARDVATPHATLVALRPFLTSGVLSRQAAAAILAHRAQLAVLAKRGRGTRFAHALYWGVFRRLRHLPKPPVTDHIGTRLHRLL